MRSFMIFDIGGSSVKWSVIDEIGEIIQSDSIKIAENAHDFFNGLAEICNEMKEKYDVCGIGISAPGAVDCETGIIGGVSAIPYIHGPNFKEILSELTKLNVEIENDANCAALGECWLGAGKDNKDMAFVVCGTGIGGAIVKDKKIHVGNHYHGGEFGYSSLKYEFDENGEPHFYSWSQIGSTGGLARKVAKLKGLKQGSINGKDVFDLCSKGDSIALQEINKYYYNMAVGIYNIQYVYDPEVIILGGAISEREEYISEINKRLDKMINGELGLEGTIKPVIKRCIYGNNANKLGALYNYLQRNK
ncbi:MAG TPA: ROK family protein [Clostridium sp.]|nr:ROK family protein [Clostridium sp.]